MASNYLVLAAILMSAASAASQTVATLKTSQTSLVFRASPKAPQLVSIGIGKRTVCTNAALETLIPSVEMGGHTQLLHWKFVSSASRVDDRHVTFVYESDSPQLRLSWNWTAPLPDGPIEHNIIIDNRESDEMWIPMQDSFRVSCRVNSQTTLEHFFVEKGAGEPSSVGTHRIALPAGYRWEGRSSTYAHPAQNEPREIIPWFAVANVHGARDGWYIGLEFSGRTRLTVERNSKSLSSVVGLNPAPGPFRTRLTPHGGFETPTVFVGAFEGGMDDIGNVLRPWFRRALGNPRSWENPLYPLIVNNSWGSGMQVDEQLARRMILDSAALGVEMFHIDAGWFRGVGDWYADPKKFPQGITAIADEAHKNGLKFGIWTDWTQAALDTYPGSLNLRDPVVRDWTISDLAADWKPEPFKGQTIDIGVPAAQAYAQSEVLRMIADYHLDMLEHDGYLVADGCVRTDHPHAPPDPSSIKISKDQGSYFVESSNSTDVSYHSVRAYYATYSEVRKLHPDLLLEICNDGGRMIDFGSAAHGDYFSMTDTYTPLANRRAFYDASYLLPPAMLEAYVENWTGSSKVEGFRHMLRSGMMGWLTLMLDTSGWSVQQRDAAKQEIQIYKDELRNLIRDADLYHVSARPDGVHWDGTEYFDPHRQRGVVYAFRGSIDKHQHTFPVRGLSPQRRYKLRFQDHSARERTSTGLELLRSGITVTLSEPNSSELIFIDAVEAGRAP